MRTVLIHSFYLSLSLLVASQQVVATPVDRQFTNSGIFIVFSQPQYAPGDTAYFAGYLLAGENQVAGNKQIVSIKLLGPNKEIIHHGRVLFQDGTGNSQIIIPHNSKSGVYQIVSYVETGSVKQAPVLHVGHIAISSRDLTAENGHHTTHAEEDTSKLTVETDRTKYGRRSKVRVSVASKVNEVEGSLNEVSIAVYNELLFSDNTDRELMSSFKAIGMEPAIIQNKGSSIAIDYPNYFMGKAFINPSGEAVPDSSKITFYLNESDFVYVVYTKSGGNFNFPLFKNFGNEEVFYRISYKGDLLTDSYIALYNAPVNVETIKGTHSDTMTAYSLYAKQKQIIDKSYHYFTARDTKTQSRKRLSSDVEADSEIFLENYEPFSSMAEVFSNIIPTVRYKKSGDDVRIRIFLKSSAQYGDNNPLYIVDGIMTDDTQYVLNFDPKHVRKIRVLRSEETLIRFGDLGINGIVVIETDITHANEDIRNSRNSLSVIGIDYPLAYKKVTYEQNLINTRVPDLRACLYWNPKVDLNKLRSFEFFTADDIGYYIIQIAGLINGQPFLSTRRFYVTQPVSR